MRGRIVGHAPGAPACIETSQAAAQPGTRRARRQTVVDEDANHCRIAIGCQFEAHAVVRDDQHPRGSEGLPGLPEGNLAFDDRFFQRQAQAQHATVHPDPRPDRAPTRIIDVHGHARAQHHQRGLAHVRRQRHRIVQVGEDPGHRRLRPCDCFLMAGEGLAVHGVTAAPDPAEAATPRQTCIRVRHRRSDARHPHDRTASGPAGRN